MAKSENARAGPFKGHIYGSNGNGLAAILVALALAMLLVGWLASTSDSAVAQAIYRQTDITAAGNLATAYSALLAALAAFACLRLSTSTATGKPDPRWLLLAICLAGLAALEVTGSTAFLPTPILVVPLLGLPAVLFLRAQLSDKHRRNLMMLTLAAALLVIAGSEQVKKAIVQDPANYTFAGNDVPYRFTASAMDNLTAVTYVQEAAELAGMLLLVILLLGMRAGRAGR